MQSSTRTKNPSSKSNNIVKIKFTAKDHSNSIFEREKYYKIFNDYSPETYNELTFNIMLTFLEFSPARVKFNKLLSKNPNNNNQNQNSNLHLEFGK